MRHAPAAIALSLVLALAGSTGLARAGDPDDPRANALLDAGRAALGRGEVALATDNLEAALAVDPANDAILLALADAARRDGMQGKAIHYYRVVLTREPNNLAAIAGEGSALAEKGAIDKARKNLTRLEGLCGKGCPETLALVAAVARGPLPAPRQVAAVPGAAGVKTN